MRLTFQLMWLSLICLQLTFIHSSASADEFNDAASPSKSEPMSKRQLNKPARRPAPAEPIQLPEALLTWDGTGELTLTPRNQAPPSETVAFGALFDIAAMTNKAGTDNTVKQTCIEGTMWFHLDDGSLWVYSGPDTRQGSPTILPGSRQIGDPQSLTFVGTSCRLVMSLEIETISGQMWHRVDPNLVPLQLSGKPTSPGSAYVNELPNQSPEINPRYMITGMGWRADDITKACPHRSGMLYFEPRGMFFVTPWGTDPSVNISIKRDLEQRQSIISMKNDKCRYIISVKMDIKLGKEWSQANLYDHNQ